MGPIKERNLEGTAEMNDRGVLGPIGKLENAVHIAYADALFDSSAKAFSLPARHLDVHAEHIAPGFRVFCQIDFRILITVREVIQLDDTEVQVFVKQRPNADVPGFKGINALLSIGEIALLG